MLENQNTIQLIHDLGRFADIAALQAQYATGRPGDFARLTSTETIWNWTGAAWVDTLVDASTLVGGKITFDDTDPTTLGNPPGGKTFAGTYEDRYWVKASSGSVTYYVTTDDFESGNWYGVEWDINISSPDVTRIGNMSYHASLPVHNKIYTCLLNDDGTENYKLNPTDWTKKLTGGDSDLSGADGQVMICIPKHYFKSETEFDIRRLKISDYALQDYTLVKKQYVSAFEATVNRTNNKLASVKNVTADYRGGNNNGAWDAEDRTLLGRPATSISRTNFRAYARNRGAGWEMYNYPVHNIITYLFVIEYATRNSQKAYNAALDGNGYKQGGLGNGVTNINSTDWNNWNSYNPFIECGYSNSLGNASGEIAFTMPTGYGTLTTYVNKYRGIELPFGHIWKNTDAINVRIGADTDADPTSKVFMTNDVTLWNDTVYTGMTEIGEIPRANGYVKEMIGGNVMPLLTGAGSSTYWCDYFYTSLPGSGEALRVVLFGGSAYHSAYAGLGAASSNASPASTNANVGSRLCFIPA